MTASNAKPFVGAHQNPSFISISKTRQEKESRKHDTNDDSRRFTSNLAVCVLISDWLNYWLIKFQWLRWRQIIKKYPTFDTNSFIVSNWRHYKYQCWVWCAGHNFNWAEIIWKILTRLCLSVFSQILSVRFFFYMMYPFTTWPIMALHNILIFCIDT